MLWRRKKKHGNIIHKSDAFFMNVIWNGEYGMIKHTTKDLPSNLITPSVSPSEFFATHLYEPKSDLLTRRIFNIIYFLYPLSVDTASYLSPKAIKLHLTPLMLNKHKFLLF